MKRKTVHINTVDDDLKKLWSWYGIELMTTVARKQWDWHSAEKRRTHLLRDCVWIGDEALACQVLELRGQGYMEERKKANSGETIKRKAGRKKGKIKPEECLKKNIELYFEYRQLISDIRKVEQNEETNDKFGWNEYIRKTLQEEHAESGTVAPRSKKKETYHTLRMPKDGVVPI